MKSMVYRRAVLPALVAFALTFLALLPPVFSLPQHGDERQYAWGGAYFLGKVTRLDFRPTGTDPFEDPGWSATSGVTALGSQLVYGAAMRLTGAPPPARPFVWFTPGHDGPETMIPPATLVVLRLAAALCAALGLGLIAWRLRWRGVAATLLFLAVPYVRDDLARAWAEGPLLLGFGLCAISYRSRWFVVACGVAATFKLTALALWPVAFLRAPLGRFRYAHTASLLVAWTVWSALTPPSWYMGGPPYLVWIAVIHGAMLYAQRTMVQDPFYVPATPEVGVSLGLFLPTRYVWPLELLVVLLVVWFAPAAWARLGVAVGRRAGPAQSAGA